MVGIEASEPIYIFQMGKVGSASLQATLAQYLDNKLIHAHCFEEMTPEDQQLLLSRQSTGQPVTIISPVRDPFSRNISAFFQTFKRDTGHELADRAWTEAELLELFLSRYPHDESLDWFDLSFRPLTGIDIYAEPFPKQRKWNVYTQGCFKVLVYRIDLDRQQQLEVVASFLGRRMEAWHFTNRAEDKDYAEIYKKFCAVARLPEDYLQRLGGSRFCRHFWDEAETRANADRWRGR